MSRSVSPHVTGRPEHEPLRPGNRRLATLAAWLWPLLGALLLATLLVMPADGARRYWPQRDILDAIRFVESSGRKDPPDGDQGRAIGPFQIHHGYWLDAVSFEPKIGGSYQDCRKRAYAERIVTAYMRRYVRAAWTRGDAQIIARVHNGGPRGHRIQATLAYWAKVRARLPR